VSLALVPPPVAGFGDRPMYSPPQRPAKEVIEHYAGGVPEPGDEMADLARAEIDQRRRAVRPSFARRGGGVEHHPHAGEEARGEHGEGDVPIPAMPGADLVVGQTALPLG